MANLLDLLTSALGGEKEDSPQVIERNKMKEQLKEGMRKSSPALDPNISEEDFQKKLANQPKVETAIESSAYDPEEFEVVEAGPNPLDEYNKKKQDLLEQQKVVDTEAAQRQITSLGDQMEVESKRAQINEELKNEEVKVLSEIDKKYDPEIESVMNQRLELSKQTPENFYARGDTVNKVLMGLAIVGAGAALGGKDGAMVGMAGILGHINKDLKEQEKLLKKRYEGLSDHERSLRMSKSDQISDLENEMNSRRLASMDILKSQIEKAKLFAKSGQAKQNLDNALIQTQDEINKLEAQAQGAIMSKVTASIGQPQAQPQDQQEAYNLLNPVDAKGKPVSLNEAQARSAQFLNKNARSVQTMEEIEKSLTSEELKALEDVAEKLSAFERVGSIPYVGNMILFGSEYAGATPKQMYKDALGDKGEKYYDALYSLVDDQTRYVTGAAIAPGEFGRELQKYTVTAGTGAASMPEIVKRRRALLKTHAQISKDNKPLFFQQQKKKGAN